MKPKVLLIGSGGVGVVSAYGLEYGGQVEVTTVIRSDYDRVTKRGYKIDSIDYGNIESYKPLHVVKDVKDAANYGPFDYILVSTKNIPGVYPIEELVRPVLTEAFTTVVLVQNGIDIEKPLISAYPQNIILSGVSTIGSTNNKGDVSHKGHDNLLIGYFKNENLEDTMQKEKAVQFIGLYNNGRNTCKYDENVRLSRWNKLVYNASFNPVCAILGIDRTSLRIFGGDNVLVEGIMEEIFNVARSEGLELNESIKKHMLEIGSDVWYKPSMLVDVEKGRDLESEVILGNVCRIASENKVPVPMITTIYELIKIVQHKYSRKEEIERLKNI